MSGGKRGATVTKQKWTEEEEAALRAGVEKYDVGKWRHIQKDEVFGPILKNRSNVDLKDKWRNLNMDSAGSRRDGRGSGDRSGGRKKRRKRVERSSEPELDDDDADYVAGRVRSTNKRRRVARRNFDDDPDVTFPEPTPEPVPVTEESILAAMIQLQDPQGSDADAISQWLEDNYGASSAVKRTVKSTLKQMMEAGRITSRHGLYRLSGIPQQLVEESSKYIGEEEEDELQNPGASDRIRTAREAAEAAARAVQEAEEAAELAAQLIAAADEYDRGTPTTEPSAKAV